jgi:hypothetical protein
MWPLIAVVLGVLVFCLLWLNRRQEPFTQEEIPKTIWTYWDSDEFPEIVQKSLDKIRESPPPVFLATACPCHGVITGLTWKNAIVVVDEMQNLNYEELRTVITRVGDHTRIIFSGDYRQSDFERFKDRQGLGNFLGILDHRVFLSAVIPIPTS